MRELQSVSLMTRQYKAQKTGVFRTIVSLSTLFSLCACQTMASGSSQQGGPSPAFRKEAVERALAFWAGETKGPFFSPFQIKEAWLSRPNSWGSDFYCITFIGAKFGQFGTYISYVYDRAGEKHITGVSKVTDAEEDTKYCGYVYSVPEAVGRMFK